MIVETFQMMGSALRRHGATDDQMPLTSKGTPLIGGYKNHPCTKWANDYVLNWRWLIRHGLALCEEYSHRYQKIHTCLTALSHANQIFPFGDPTGRSGKDPKPFVRAMPDEFKLDTSIDTFTAYKMYISSKPWVASNYLRDPSRKPDWV